MPKLYVTKGLPASGKTTWAKKLVEEKQGKLKRFNKDDLRAMIDGGKWTKGNEQFVKNIQKLMAGEAVKAGFDVVIDDTNLVEATFQSWLGFAINNDCEVHVEDFTHVPVQLCIERDKQRINSVGEEVIRRMNKLIPRQSRPVPQRRPVEPGLPWCVICDIDGTIAHMGDKRGPFEWKKVGVDIPDAGMKELLKRLMLNAPTLFYFSGRDGVCRPETLKWLVDHDFPPGAMEEGQMFNLVMRPEGDSRSDAIVKREMFDTHIAGKYNVLCVLDDRDRVVDMWRNELGLLVMQVARGDF